MLSPMQEPSNGDLQRQILENHPEGSWGKQNQQENETPEIPAHPQGHRAICWESPGAPLTAPEGSQGIRHHHTGTLPCWHKLKESRAAAGNQHESTQGLRYLSGKGEARCEH